MNQATIQLITTIVAAVTGIGGIIIAGISLSLTYKYNMKLLKDKQQQEEREDIRIKLNEFYGPYQQLLETSRQLYEKFKFNKDSEWRTLPALLLGEKLTDNDKQIFDQIIQVTDQLEDLRIKHSGLIDDSELQILLAKAGAHFRIIKAAYKGELVGEVNRFQDYVFPRELNAKIDAKIESLDKRRRELYK